MTNDDDTKSTIEAAIAQVTEYIIAAGICRAINILRTGVPAQEVAVNAVTAEDYATVDAAAAEWDAKTPVKSDGKKHPVNPESKRQKAFGLYFKGKTPKQVSYLLTTPLDVAKQYHRQWQKGQR